jgi:hypothetical protein
MSLVFCHIPLFPFSGIAARYMYLLAFDCLQGGHYILYNYIYIHCYYSLLIINLASRKLIVPGSKNA